MDKVVDLTKQGFGVGAAPPVAPARGPARGGDAYYMDLLQSFQFPEAAADGGEAHVLEVDWDAPAAAAEGGLAGFLGGGGDRAPAPATEGGLAGFLGH